MYYLVERELLLKKISNTLCLAIVSWFPFRNWYVSDYYVWSNSFFLENNKYYEKRDSYLLNKLFDCFFAGALQVCILSSLSIQFAMSRRPVNPNRRLVESGTTSLVGSLQSKSRSSPYLSLGLVVLVLLFPIHTTAIPKQLALFCTNM